ncbi:MAG: ABC transporter substrate-binding protein [Alphaproteobacteria bacterium]|nr:ABC transporter substrate-binding protein [Alphaproteobacteria bacterium]
MKKLTALICAMMLSVSVMAAQNPAISFVDDLADDIISNVLTAEVTPEQKLETFRAAFTKAVDLKSVGQFVLGVYWRKANDADKQEFLDAFTEFTTKTWADRFDMYHGQDILFTGVRNAERNQYYVDSQIQDKEPVEVIWRLRQKGDSYKIIDIIVEGVSMAMSYRNEYSAVLQQNGGNVKALAEELRKKSAAFDNQNKK